MIALCNRTREEFNPWLALRDSHPSALIQVAVLAKRRKALIVYGHGHFQRRQIQSNFEMSDWRMQTVVSLLERSTPHKVFTIWRLRDELTSLVPGASSFVAPTLLTTRGTSPGAADVALLSPAWTTMGRMAIQDGKLVPVPKEPWLPLPVEELLDAVLHLGLRTGPTQAPIPTRPARSLGSWKSGSDELRWRASHRSRPTE